MAIKEIKREWSPCQLDYVKTFLLHSEKELKDLPKCCIGSKAIVSETDNEYFCTESGWKLGSELGGGSSEVVILPETELTVINASDDGGQYMLSTPFATEPTVGGTYKLMWGGVEYTSKAVDMSALVEQGMPPCMVLGNVAITGAVEGVENPDPSAPYAMMIYKDGIQDGDLTAYAVMVSVGITPEPPVLSIVQTEGAASGGGSASAGGGVLFVNATASEDLTTATVDKTYADIMAAINAGQYCVCNLSAAGMMLHLPMANSSTGGVAFGLNLSGQSFVVSVIVDGTVQLEVSTTD